MKKDIIIAVPRGRIIDEAKKFLNKTSFAPDPLLYDSKTRKLTFGSKKKNIKYIKVRAFDVCTFVAFGAAQIGIAGDDIIQEFAYSEVYAPLKLNIGHCRLSVAAPLKLINKEDPSTWSNIRIATKYPNLTREFLFSKGVTQFKLVSSLGATEAYPFTESSEIITDITSTGETLKANNLRILKDGEILKSEACMMVSRLSAKKKALKSLTKLLSKN